MTQITFLPILAAGIVSAIIGVIWYHPRVFGTAWMSLSGITPEAVESGKRRMPAMAAIALLASMLSAYVIGRVAVGMGVYDVVGAMRLGFWLWIGFVAPAMLGIVLWEQKPVKLYLINALYWLVAIVVMAAILLL